MVGNYEYVTIGRNGFAENAARTCTLNKDWLLCSLQSRHSIHTWQEETDNNFMKFFMKNHKMYPRKRGMAQGTKYYERGLTNRYTSFWMVKARKIALQARQGCHHWPRKLPEFSDILPKILGDL